MTLYVLNELQYSTDRQGPWALYIYNAHGFHSGKRWFGKTVTHPGEEITLDEVRELVNNAMDDEKEIRITDGGDNLVFHAIDGDVIYGERFFYEITS